MEHDHHKGVARHPCGECCTKLVNVGVAFGGQRIFEDVSLHLHCGELTTLVGPNGAGKSTLLRTLLGEVPHTGEIHFLPVFGHGREDAPAIGYVPQFLEFDRFSPISVQDAFSSVLSRWPVVLWHRRRDRATAREALEAVEAGHLCDRKLGELSGGELQRVLLALSLTPVPNLLLLDEPVSGIDLPGRELFYRTVSDLRRRFDLSILMVSHDLAGVSAVSDRVIFLDHRIVASGTPAEVIAHPEVRRTFGLDVPSLPPQTAS
ncbi:MAG: metal ABC transporter ATP-binding protein [Chthoniobacteraceae bacterium]